MTAQNKNNEAMHLYRTIIEHYSMYSRDAREEALKSADNLAQVLATQGQLAEAEDMGRWLVSERERLLGDDHLDTLIGIHTLAGMLFTQKKSNIAKPWDCINEPILEYRSRWDMDILTQ
jgi:hypothetical protein